ELGSEILETQLSTPKMTLRDEDAEKEHILEALRQTGNNKSRAAQLLDIDRKTLYNYFRYRPRSGKTTSLTRLAPRHCRA
ncbi:helix-turn-helix domain-containing protein, partial [Bacteroides fragilis]|uniref:helix-turn-helix domain-containing protein n=1 Tax=Bacteroides fragilis TaxID=817 RepID=UPI0029340FC2